MGQAAATRRRRRRGARRSSPTTVPATGAGRCPCRSARSSTATSARWWMATPSTPPRATSCAPWPPATAASAGAWPWAARCTTPRSATASSWSASGRWTRPAGERATPRVFATAGNRVLWIDRGALESFDAATGRLLWRTSGVVHAGEFSAELTVTGDVVIVGLGVDPAYKPVTAYDLATGKERWRLRPSAEAAVVGAGPAGVAVATRGERQRWGSLELVDAATGTVRWSQPLTGWIQQDMVDAINRQALVTADEVVYVEQFSNLGVGRSARDGGVRWRTRLPGGSGWPQWAAAGRLLISGFKERSGSAESFLASLDIGSGRITWSSRLPTNSDRPATPLGDGAVIQVADPQRACAVDGRVSGPRTAEGGTPRSGPPAEARPA